MRDWQKVYQDQQEYRAEIVRSILEEKGMSPVLICKKDSAYQLGHFEIHVASEHVIKAIKMINEDINFE